MKKTFKIIDIIDNKNCLDPKLGDMVFRAIAPELINGNAVELDFCDVKLIVTHFLDSAVGRLYNPKTFDVNCVKNNLTFKNLGTRESLIADVIDNAINYYRKIR